MSALVPVLTAASGEPWEAALVARSGDAALGLEVVARCFDIVDLLATAQVGAARVAVAAGDLRHLDREAVARLHGLGLAVVAVGGPARLREIGVAAVVEAPATPELIGQAVSQALACSDPALEPPTGGGRIVAVWGPAGAPGRSTVGLGLADEAAVAGAHTLLVDLDTYGASIATQLGLLDEAPGVTAAVRAASTGALTVTTLQSLTRGTAPGCAVLTGLPRPDRWNELRDAALAAVLEATRHLATFVVVDVGFSVEADEELSYDIPAPRRNGATITAIESSDVVVAVAAADPLGLQRFVRALPDVRALMRSDAELLVVVNKVRASAIGRDADRQVREALARHAGVEPAALLPHDLSTCDAALVQGRTLREVAPASALRTGIVDVARRLTGAPIAVRRRSRRPVAHRGGR